MKWEKLSFVIIDDIDDILPEQKQNIVILDANQNYDCNKDIK